MEPAVLYSHQTHTQQIPKGKQNTDSQSSFTHCSSNISIHFFLFFSFILPPPTHTHSTWTFDAPFQGIHSKRCTSGIYCGPVRCPLWWNYIPLWHPWKNLRGFNYSEKPTGEPRNVLHGSAWLWVNVFPSVQINCSTKFLPWMLLFSWQLPFSSSEVPGTEECLLIDFKGLFWGPLGLL